MTKWNKLDEKGRKTYLTSFGELFDHLTGENVIPPPAPEKTPSTEPTEGIERLFVESEDGEC